MKKIQPAREERTNSLELVLGCGWGLCLSDITGLKDSFLPVELVPAFPKRALETLYNGFQKIRRTTCPFVNLPERTHQSGVLRENSAVLIRSAVLSFVPLLKCVYRFWYKGGG